MKDKYIERAGEVLYKIILEEREKLTPVDEAVNDLLYNLSAENLGNVEIKFEINSIEIIYLSLKKRYFSLVEFPVEIERKIFHMKQFLSRADQDAFQEAKKIYSEIKGMLAKLEKKIKKRDKHYNAAFI